MWMQTCGCMKNMENISENKTESLCIHYNVQDPGKLNWTEHDLFSHCVHLWFRYSYPHSFVVWLGTFSCFTFCFRSCFATHYCSYSLECIRHNNEYIVVHQTTLNTINSMKRRHWNRSSMCIFGLCFNSPSQYRYSRRRRHRRRQQQ